MSTADTINGFQVLHRTISGVRKAPTKLPGALNTADMPIVLVWPGSGTLTGNTNGRPRHDCDYIVTCFVEPVGQGLSVIDTQTHDVFALLWLFIQAYQTSDNLTLANTNGFVATLGGNEQSIHHSGVRGDLAFGDLKYRGFQFTVPVMEKW